MKYTSLLLFLSLSICVSAQDFLELNRIDSAIINNKVAEMHTERKRINDNTSALEIEVCKYDTNGRLVSKITTKGGKPQTSGTFAYNNTRLISSDIVRNTKVNDKWEIERTRESYTYSGNGDTVYVARYISQNNSDAISDILKPYGQKVVRYDKLGNITYLYEKSFASTGFKEHLFTYDTGDRQTSSTYNMLNTDSSFYTTSTVSTYNLAQNSMRSVSETEDDGTKSSMVWNYKLNAKGKIISGHEKSDIVMQNIFYTNGLLKESSYTMNGQTAWVKKTYLYR